MANASPRTNLLSNGSPNSSGKIELILNEESEVPQVHWLKFSMIIYFIGNWISILFFFN